MSVYARGKDVGRRVNDFEVVKLVLLVVEDEEVEMVDFGR